MIDTKHAVIDQRGKGRLEIMISLDRKRESTMVTVMDCSDCTNLLESTVRLGVNLGTTGNSRRDVGDMGEMWGLGYRDKSKEEAYVKSRDDDYVKALMTEVCKNVKSNLGDRFNETLQSIRKAKATGIKCTPLKEMGGAQGPGSCIMISKNLGNSAHYDFRDMSMSLGMEDCSNIARQSYSDW